MTLYDRWKTTDREGDAPDPLEGKPLGYCPWCRSALFLGENEDREEATGHLNPYPVNCSWAESETETENRIRYAAQVLEESAMWKKIEKEGGDA